MRKVMELQTKIGNAVDHLVRLRSSTLNNKTEIAIAEAELVLYRLQQQREAKRATYAGVNSAIYCGPDTQCSEGHAPYTIGLALSMISDSVESEFLLNSDVECKLMSTAARKAVGLIRQAADLVFEAEKHSGMSLWHGDEEWDPSNL